jgi:D-alanyl-lipoteichoic acid acyltransferase DltB (MBOAT superfamily)
MLFTEARFLVFFLVAFAVHWALRSNRLRKLWLLVGSYVFYGAWDERFLTLILFSTVVDYVAGARIGASESPRTRRLWLTVSLVANLGVLGFFKYYNFFARSAVDLLELLGFQANPATLDIILPLGISFYTFQTMSYTIDVYRRRLEPVKGFFDFAVFVSFFPQLVAGPIVRAVQFLPQLEKTRVFAKHVDVRACLTLFLIGYLKKAVLADQVAMEIDPVFQNPEGFTVGSIWITIALYAVQIYGDFAGYSDMAIATGGLLGYKLPLNFYFPYLARNISQFWQRWHISLSSWMRDYVYVSLDRSVSGWRGLNLVFTFVLVGFWHGASWNFVFFGLMHGLFLLAHGWFSQAFPRSFRGPLGFLAGNALVIFGLGMSLILFRCQTFEAARTMYEVTYALNPGGAGVVSTWWLLFLAVCLAAHWAFYKGAEKSIARVPDWLYYPAYGALWALVLPWAAQGYQPFIYFQF